MLEPRFTCRLIIIMPLFIVLGRHRSTASCSTTWWAPTGRQLCNVLSTLKDWKQFSLNLSMAATLVQGFHFVKVPASINNFLSGSPYLCLVISSSFGSEIINIQMVFFNRFHINLYSCCKARKDRSCMFKCYSITCSHIHTNQWGSWSGRMERNVIWHQTKPGCRRRKKCILEKKWLTPYMAHR